MNPGLILGPSLVPASEAGSVFLMNELMAGYFFYGAPGFSFTFADVRDVAAAHIAAAENPAASGRYILARPEMVSMHEMAQIRGGRLPAGPGDHARPLRILARSTGCPAGMIVGQNGKLANSAGD